MFLLPANRSPNSAQCRASAKNKPYCEPLCPALVSGLPFAYNRNGRCPDPGILKVKPAGSRADMFRMAAERREIIMSRRIILQGLNNTRDLGGMPAADGRIIRPGLLIRSGHLYSASPDDIVWLSGHVALIVDFRTPQEKEEKPDPEIPGVSYLHLPAFESLSAGVSRDEKSNEEAFAMVAGNPDGALEYMKSTYRGFVENKFTLSRYSRFVHLLLESRDSAVLWHCTAGKDRAGFASVIVEEMLGVDRADIKADYLATNEFLASEISQLNEMVGRQMGGLNKKSEKALDWLFGAHEEFLDAALEKADEIYGSFDDFIRDGLDISDMEREKLKMMYLEARQQSSPAPDHPEGPAMT